MSTEDYLSRLVALKTISGDHKAAEECVNQLAMLLKGFGLHVNRHVSNGFPSLFATTQQTKTPKIILQAHLDVVPATDHAFSLVKNEIKLIGRGVYDMKFAAASYLSVIDQLQGNLDKYDFGVMFTFDEEFGGDDGVGYLLDQGYGGKIALIPDGASDWRIEESAKGAWFIEVVAAGESAHGSRPWEGDNALQRIIGAVNEIQALAPESKADGTTISLNKVHGGHAMNQVPNKASATLDIRFNSDEDHIQLETDVQKILERFHLTHKTLLYVNAFTANKSAPLLKNWKAIVEKTRNEPVTYERSLGGSDARHFFSKNIDVIVTRPKGGNAHADNEWILRSDLETFTSCVRDFITV